MTKFTLEIEIGGEPKEASSALDAALDVGALQDFVNASEGVRADRATVTEEKELDKKLTRFTVEIEIEGDRSAAAQALDDAIDDEVLQDFINGRSDVTVGRAAVVYEQATRR